MIAHLSRLYSHPHCHEKPNDRSIGLSPFCHCQSALSPPRLAIGYWQLAIEYAAVRLVLTTIWIVRMAKAFASQVPTVRPAPSHVGWQCEPCGSAWH